MICLVIMVVFAVFPAFGAWQADTHFSLGTSNGMPVILDPDGHPFKSVGMVWAYGPEEGEFHQDLTPERVIEHLQMLKDLGFNTLNLYGEAYIPEMLNWCDENEIAVYFRTSYGGSLPEETREYPDFMDSDIRRRAISHYDGFLKQIGNHPSVLAIDMDHRWIFPLDWAGRRRIDEPQLGPAGIAHFPAWLKEKYGTIDILNGKWKTDYTSFAAVIADPSLVGNGKVQKLGYHPARVDLMRYTLWTATDFISELAAAIHKRVPGVMLTPTTEHPECIPEMSPRVKDTGIAFMSPVHYNSAEDFEREMPSFSKLIYETRWHYDIQGGPAYISETGWRTRVLNQNPPNMRYAWIPSQDEEAAARMYAKQFALLSVMPWVGGYGYFKLYDKWPEGDFGYLRDDGSKKPQALIGDAVNEAFQSILTTDPAPEVWIYYPKYAHTTTRPGFAQFKSWVQLWEKPFMDALERRVHEHWEGLSAGDRAVGSNFAACAAADFETLWRGFAFTEKIPADGKPVVLFSSIMEFMSDEDREQLRDIRTISFGEIGSRDLFMNETVPWDIDILGLTSEDAMESVMSVPHFPQICTGQTIRLPEASFNRLDLCASSRDGDAAGFIDLAYVDGGKERLVLGPAITDAKHPAAMTTGGFTNSAHFSRLSVPLEPMSQVEAITLPDASWITIHSADLVTGGFATNIRVALTIDYKPIEGETRWCRLLRKSTNSVTVLQHFDSGYPAVLASGPHAVFAYDPLTWTGRKNDISACVGAHDRLIERCLTYLREVDQRATPDGGARNDRRSTQAAAPRQTRHREPRGSGTWRSRRLQEEQAESKATPITDWQICGPFTSDGLFDAVVADERSLCPANAPADGKWIACKRESGVIHLEDDALMGNNDYSSAYAYTQITSDDERDMNLLLGSDDGIMAWWNGRLVLANEVFRGVTADKDIVHVRAKRGTNTLLLKIFDEAGGWGFSAATATCNAQEE
ncbi:MAG: beta-galactosidase [Verrucomicrobia bacterium]|nr:beta-galactosidase [Verrucomicrobiota bacterium]